MKMRIDFTSTCSWIAASICAGCYAPSGALVTGTSQVSADAASPDVGTSADQPDVGTAADQSDVGQKSTSWNPAEPHVISGDNVRVEMPAGALAHQVAVTITAMADAPAGCVGPAWQFGPDGQTFDKPVRIVLGMAPGLVPAKDFAKLRLATVVAGKWQALAVTGTKPEANEVWGETAHFSPYCAIPASQPAPDGPCAGLPQAANGTCTCTAAWASSASQSYGYCKALFVAGLDACGDSYKPFEAFEPCCVPLLDAIGGPASTGQKQPPIECMAKAACATAMADPWGTAVKCGAFQ